MRLNPTTSGPRSYLGYISRKPCSSYPPLPALDNIQVIFIGFHAPHPHHFRSQIIFRLYLQYTTLLIPTTFGPRSYLGYIYKIPCSSSPPLPVLDHIQVIFPGYNASHPHHFRSQIIFRLYFQDTMLLIPTTSGPRLYSGYISRIQCSSYPPLQVLDYIQVIFLGFHAPHPHNLRSQIILLFRLYFQDTMLLILTTSGPRSYLGYISRRICSSSPPLPVLDHIQVIFPGFPRQYIIKEQKTKYENLKNFNLTFYVNIN